MRGQPCPRKVLRPRLDHTWPMKTTAFVHRLIPKMLVSAAPPAIWEQLFQKTLSRLSPLIAEPDMVVFKIGADEEIRRLLASDPILREVALKVEGLRIAVHQTDLKKLAKRLEQFGYPNPIPRLR